jgi:vancomycin permeability regulator SanA
MSSKFKGIVSIIVILLLIVHLLFFYFIKYKNQGLTLEDFSFGNIGNVLNLVFTLILIIGLIIYSFLKKNSVRSVLIILYSIILSALLLACWLTQNVKIPGNDIYYFDQPLNKIMVGGIFSLYQFMQFIFISVIWLSVFTEKKLMFIRVLVNSVIIFIILLLFAYFYMDIQISRHSEDFKVNDETNIAVVLGAAVWSNNQPSPTLVSRVNKAARLYKKGIVNKIQLTGSNAPGELSEAEVAYRYIVTKGVDSSNIFVETNTTSTTEQIKFIKQNLILTNSFKNIIVVSDEYHLTRVKEISRFYNVKLMAASSDLNLSFDKMLYNKIRESVGLLIFWFFAL